MVGDGFGSLGCDCQYLSAFAGSRRQESIRRRKNSAIYDLGKIMNNIFDKKHLGLAVSCALAFAVLPSVAHGG